MIRSLLYLEPKDGDARPVVDFYRAHDVLGRAARHPGCLGSELQLPLTAGGPVLVTALWESREAYDGWVADPSRGAWAAELGALLSGELTADTRGSVFDVVLAAPERAA